MREWHEADLAAGYGEAPLPDALSRKYPTAAREWGWQYVFPANEIAVDPALGETRCYHVCEKEARSAVRQAAFRAACILAAMTLRECRLRRLVRRWTLLSRRTGQLPSWIWSISPPGHLSVAYYSTHDSDNVLLKALLSLHSHSLCGRPDADFPVRRDRSRD